jgi:uncharacterized membrane protein
MSLRADVTEAAESIRDSYWFLPALFAVIGVAAAVALVAVDSRLGTDWLSDIDWLYGSQPAGAQAALSTIAGSTITVAGVVFSITLAAFTYASGQYGPQLLTNFLRDKGNQATLGVFVGVYLYCLVVLRTIHAAGEGEGPDAIAAFVPHLAIYGAYILAAVSIAVLIYFFHHVTDRIHISNVIADVGQALIAQVRRSREGETIQAPPEDLEWEYIDGIETGYIKAIDGEALCDLAAKDDLVLRLRHRVGDFVHDGMALMDVSPARDVGAEMRARLNQAFVIGQRRSPLQDRRLRIQQLVQIAARALSPGINDPFTAMSCVDWLGAAMAEIAQRPPEENVRRDTEGKARVYFLALTFTDYLDSAFGQLRPYVAADPTARAHTLAVLDDLYTDVWSDDYKIAVSAEKDRLGAYTTP